METSNTTKTRRVLVGVDFSRESELAVEAALGDAAAHPGTELHALFVYEPAVDPVSGLGLPLMPRLSECVANLRALLVEHLKLHLEGKPVLKVVAHARVGWAAQELAKMASEIEADLVVVGTHGRRGPSRWIMGSVAELTLRRAPCPVLVVRPKNPIHPEPEPTVEPLCEACAARRAETKGAEMWCARHAEHHPHAHVYSYEGPSSSNARPWGFT